MRGNKMFCKKESLNKKVQLPVVQKDFLTSLVFCGVIYGAKN